MKKLIGFVFVFICVFALLGCPRRTNVSIETEADTPTDTYHFHAKVIEVHDRYMLVEHLPDGKTLSADIIEVPFEEKTSWPIPAVGDTVEVYYDGTIMETYPARLSRVYRVEILVLKRTDDNK